MNIDDCISVIRPYHHNKQLIVKKIYNLVLNFLAEYSSKIDNFTNIDI